ncbi:MAG: hypothetical protein NTX72_02330 [Candidatus Uhrbacteria bacterium]|nr:hypothetical protein [Candidatus Uhrbacteria bacterium]
MSSEEKLINELEGERIKTPDTILNQAVYLSLHPGRLILLPFRHWFNKRYLGRYKFDRAVFSFDLALMSSVITLFIIALFLILVPPKQFRDDIVFLATVAPHEIISGASSTLVIDYQNKTKESLQHPKLDLTFPNHFLLQSVSYNGSNVDAKNIALEDIPAGGTGTIHIQGVMFGDVGGTQTFGSTLSFNHGTKKIVSDRKTAEYTFSPTHSTLSLHLDLPTSAIASQSMSGIITYKNTGSIDLKEVRIKPEWPNGFTFQDTSTQIQNGAYVLSNVKAGSSGEIRFEGKLGAVSDHLSFIFHPSFVFDRDVYKQETLTQSVPVLPAQIQLSESVETDRLTPGSNAIFHVHYKHVGNETLHDISIAVTSRDPFLSTQNAIAPIIHTLKQGEQGDVTFTIPVRDRVVSNLLTSYENLHVRTQAIAHYTLESKPNEQLSTGSDELLTPLTTPLTLESFARYTSPGGDQIGRGSLPPRVSQKTSYWIFWHVDGTTNSIQSATIEGTLPENVTYSGHETSSEDGGVSYDTATHKITWNVANIPPTLDPTSKVFSVAFEVTLIPTQNQVGSPAPLLKNVHFSGKDALTGEILTTKNANILTNLADDQLAKNKGSVQN